MLNSNVEFRSSNHFMKQKLESTNRALQISQNELLVNQELINNNIQKNNNKLKRNPSPFNNNRKTSTSPPDLKR